MCILVSDCNAASIRTETHTVDLPILPLNARQHSEFAVLHFGLLEVAVSDFASVKIHSLQIALLEIHSIQNCPRQNGPRELTIREVDIAELKLYTAVQSGHKIRRHLFEILIALVSPSQQNRLVQTGEYDILLFVVV